MKSQRFLVCGASSGFGRAIAEQLLSEGAQVIAAARRQDLLEELADEHPGQVTAVIGDLTAKATHDKIETAIGDRSLHGAVINAGGPPALAPLETEISDWDQAYETVMRWKIQLSLSLIPYFTDNNYGRLLFIESQSVKQPLPPLVLSNSFRAGVVGFAKSLALEVAEKGITVNALAPGSHNTPAIERVIQKKVNNSDKSFNEMKQAMETSIPVGRFGKGKELASLATWLLSSHAGYVTGQTISHDGGNIKGIFG